GRCRRARVRLRRACLRRRRRSLTGGHSRAADDSDRRERGARGRRRGRDARPRRSRRGRRAGSVAPVTYRFVTFLSAFGLTDDFVGTCHGGLKRLAPDVEIIDITHGIAPQAVLQGALVLRNTVRYMPLAVHLAVVDPGVGSSRRPLVLRDTEGLAYVGPDNGLLVPAAECNGIESAHELANPAYALETAARTFGDARPGEIVLFEDSYKNIAVAINRGSAAEMFFAHAGQPLVLHLNTP